MPIRALPSGTYAYEIHLFADSQDTGHWDIAEYGRDPSLGAGFPPPASGKITERGRQVVSGTFVNPKRANIAIRVWYDHGTLFVDKIRFRRIGDAATEASLFTVDGSPTVVDGDLGSETLEPSLRLIEPRAGTFLPDAWVDFAWQWTGPPLEPGQAFEVRLWQEGDAYAFGAHDAAADRALVRQVGDVYMLRLDVNGAYAMQTRAAQAQGAGEYLWSVALVEVEPAYREVGPPTAPQRVYIVR